MNLSLANPISLPIAGGVAASTEQFFLVDVPAMQAAIANAQSFDVTTGNDVANCFVGADTYQHVDVGGGVFRSPSSRSSFFHRLRLDEKEGLDSLVGVAIAPRSDSTALVIPSEAAANLAAAIKIDPAAAELVFARTTGILQATMAQLVASGDAESVEKFALMLAGLGGGIATTMRSGTELGGVLRPLEDLAERFEGAARHAARDYGMSYQMHWLAGALAKGIFGQDELEQLRFLLMPISAAVTKDVRSAEPWARRMKPDDDGTVKAALAELNRFDFKKLVEIAWGFNPRAIEGLRLLSEAGHVAVKEAYAEFTEERIARKIANCTKPWEKFYSLLKCRPYFGTLPFLHDALVRLIATNKFLNGLAIEKREFKLIGEAAKIDTQALKWLLNYKSDFLKAGEIITYWLTFVGDNAELFIPLIEKEIDSPSRWPLFYQHAAERRELIYVLLRAAAKKSQKIDRYLRDPAFSKKRFLGSGFDNSRPLL